MGVADTSSLGSAGRAGEATGLKVGSRLLLTPDDQVAACGGAVGHELEQALGDRVGFRILGAKAHRRYFQAIRSRPDRVIIRDEWIRQVMATPEHEETQKDRGFRP